MAIKKRDLQDVFEYLDALRDSGITNMYGAGRYLQDEYGYERREAGKYLVLWMKTFSDAPMTSRVSKALELNKETK